MSRYDWVKGNVPPQILEAEEDAEQFGTGFLLVKRSITGVIEYERIDPEDVFIRVRKTKGSDK